MTASGNGGKGGAKKRRSAAKTDRSQADDPGVAARSLALDALKRIDKDAFANILLPKMLAGSELDERDRGLVTELVYGTTRMRRSCDWLVDRFLLSEPQPELRSALRLGAYQLAYTRIPAHAAVSATVAAVPKRQRGVLNAVLRKVSKAIPESPEDWPDQGTRLSYPDWMLERLGDELGATDAIAALEVMNTPPSVTERADGYIQDIASQWVVEAVDAQPGEKVLDLCAAPGGKATALAAAGATVYGVDRRLARSRLVAGNAQRVGADNVHTLVADGGAPPFRPGSFDRVLVDAPCSGLGVLRRRPDARWRIGPADVENLARIQERLLRAAIDLVKPGGTLVYSVCTVVEAETSAVAASVGADPRLAPLPVGGPEGRWTALGEGGRILPQHHDTDGMALFRWQVSSNS